MPLLKNAIYIKQKRYGHFGIRIYRKTTTSSSKSAFIWRRVPFLHEFCRAHIFEFASEFMSPDYFTPEKVDECVKGFEAIGFLQCLGAFGKT